MKELFQLTNIFLSGSEAGRALEYNESGGEGIGQRARQFPRITHHRRIAKPAALSQLIGGEPNFAIRSVIVRVCDRLKCFERKLEIWWRGSAPPLNRFQLRRPIECLLDFKQSETLEDFRLR
jgi:hypothetical protein